MIINIWYKKRGRQKVIVGGLVGGMLAGCWLNISFSVVSVDVVIYFMKNLTSLMNIV